MNMKEKAGLLASCESSSLVRETSVLRSLTLSAVGPKGTCREIREVG
jgi:hypothetical protein